MSDTDLHQALKKAIEDAPESLIQKASRAAANATRAEVAKCEGLRRQRREFLSSTDILGGPISSLEAFARCLARHLVVQPVAVEDPEGYDGGETMRRCAAAHREIHESLEAEARKAVEDLRKLMEGEDCLPPEITLSEIVKTSLEQ
jgi:hypothetical protein